MIREAVALGTPVLTVFEGRLGAVDELLIAEGRMARLEHIDQITLAKWSGGGAGGPASGVIRRGSPRCCVIRRAPPDRAPTGPQHPPAGRRSALTRAGGASRLWRYRPWRLVSDTTLQPPAGPRVPGPPVHGCCGHRPFARRYAWWLVAVGSSSSPRSCCAGPDRARAMTRTAGWIGAIRRCTGQPEPRRRPLVEAVHVHLTVPLLSCSATARSPVDGDGGRGLAGGAIFAGRIAYRLTDGARSPLGGDPWPRSSAGASVLGIQQYFHYILSAQSDDAVTFCLAAIDCYLCKRLGWAWWLGVAAGLGRPEVWPF